MVRENNRDSQRVSDEGSLLNSRIRARDIESSAGCVRDGCEVAQGQQTSWTHLVPAMLRVYNHANVPSLRASADSGEALTELP